MLGLDLAWWEWLTWWFTWIFMPNKQVQLHDQAVRFRGREHLGQWKDRRRATCRPNAAGSASRAAARSSSTG